MMGILISSDEDVKNKLCILKFGYHHSHYQCLMQDVGSDTAEA